MSVQRQRLLSFYALTLRLYPEPFRQRYAGQMLSIASQQSADTPSSPRFVAELATDTARSLIEVHMRSATPAKPAYILLFAAFFSALLLFVSVFHQQVLRRAADRAPEQLTSALSGELAHHGDRSLTLPNASNFTDLTSLTWLNSASTFAAVYDVHGNLIASNATLNQSMPRPPQGVFDTIRARGLYKVTWQPQQGVRIALTGRQIPGGGFVLAGQSLLDGESRTARFNQLLMALWAMLLIACGIILAMSNRRRMNPA